MSAAAVSRPAETQRPATQTPHGKAPADKPAETDLFASLLNLVSDTHLAPDAATPAATELPAADAADGEAADPNPLTALLAWATPNAAPSAPNSAPSAPTGAAPTPAAPATALDQGPGATPPASGAPAALPQASGVDITGMTPVVNDPPTTIATTPAVSTEPAAPASPAARPAFATPASRPAFASRLEAPAHSSAPAMVWQRGAVSSTDALQQQFASHSIQQAGHAPMAHTRSTVALDERFALASATAAQTGMPREAGFEFTLPGNGGLRTGTTEAGPGVGSPTLADGGATGDSTGGSSGDALPGEQSGSAHDGTPAERETDGPTVSHWGTQHLRHASLRVGESGADAIDIQLSMKGQEVQVAFQSDSAEARASLREGASDALSELLQRSGIQLGHVSVGSQGQHGGGAAPHTPTVSRGEAGARTEPTAPVPAAPPPRTDGSRPLDLFV